MEGKHEIYERAEKNEDGDYILKKGHDWELNVSKMFRPGKRKTQNVQMLVIEARLADEKGELDNPAFPYNESVADRALSQLDDEGLEPAWLSGPHQGNSHD